MVFTTERFHCILKMGFLIFTMIFFFHSYVLEIIYTSVKSLLSLKGVAHVVLACYVWINTLFHYLAAACVGPGRQPLKHELEEESYDVVSTDFCTECIRKKIEKGIGVHHCQNAALVSD